MSRTAHEATPAPAAPAPEPTARLIESLPLLGIAAVVALACQLIGSATIPLGTFGSVVFFPRIDVGFDVGRPGEQSAPTLAWRSNLVNSR